ncbi:riboflavin synthase, partial [Candidatus Parcubacteria bacterium]
DKSPNFCRIKLKLDKIKNPQIGNSIALNGICLTVADYKDNIFTFEVMGETLKKADIANWKIGDLVNIEQPLRAGDEFGGHFVLGHVDGIGKITQIIQYEENAEIDIEIPVDLRPFIVRKGSVAVDGISLTVAEVLKDGFRVALIPLTLQKTTLGRKEKGSSVNIEADYLLKAALKNKYE